MHHDHQRRVLSPRGLDAEHGIEHREDVKQPEPRMISLFCMTPPLDAAATKEWSLDVRVADHPRLFDDRHEPGPHSNVFLGVGTTLVPAPARHKRAGGFP